MCRLLPRSHGLPRFPGGSASASSLSRPPQASRALRPAGLLNRPRRPSSRGFDQAVCPARPLVSYQINRQLSRWNLPPLVIRAVGAHVESRTGAVAWALCGNAPFPVPAHQTGRADFPHPAFRLVSPRGTRRRAEFGVCCRSSGRWQTRPATPIGVRLRRGVQLLQKRPDTQGCSRLIANHRSSAPSKAHQKQGPFPPPALPGLNGRMALSDSRPTRRLCDVGAASPHRDGSPPMTRITLPTCRAPYPGGSRRVHVSIASPLTRPSPFPRRVGIRIFTFEASSGFTRVTARWIAQPPKAAFVTRLRPGRLPRQAARQLPDQSTTLWVEPSSTGDTRRRGARRVEDGRGSLGLVWQRSVSRPRSSNRTCGPASGFPTGFTARHTAARRVRCVLRKQWAMADAPSNTDRRPSSPRGKASSEASGCSGVFQAHPQSPILGSLQSAPEARALSSASMTRPPRSYGPLRLPSDPPPVRRWGCQPPVETGLPR